MISSLTINETNLSYAWARVFLATMERGQDTRHPATVIISGLTDSNEFEDRAVRKLLDSALKTYGLNSCGTVSNTIFPKSLWNASNGNDMEELFARYERAWHGIKKCPANRNGVYFRRLTNYQPQQFGAEPVNQLASVVSTYLKGNHRNSALQAAIFDPTRDHSDQRQKGFPCLQQVSFTPLGGGGLSISGMYATQLVFEKAYGNYLGLYWLGRFMAKQLGLTLVQVVCNAAVLHRSHNDRTKAMLEPLAVSLREMLSPL